PLKNNVILKECEARPKNLLNQKSFRHSYLVKRIEESHRILTYIPRDSSPAHAGSQPDSLKN
ncbi:hypothetical protein IJE86_09315, partial [bacterium]|nr:hypothetical protein [bacterium]